MKRLVPAVVATIVAATAAQSPGHPFAATAIVPSIDTFVIVMRVTGNAWRPIGGVVQTVARDTSAIRVAVDYSFTDSKRRVEMAMDPGSLAPIAHWETLWHRGRGEARGEIMIRDGRALGAYIASKGLIDMPLDSGVVDDDASTALLPTLPLDTGRTFSFRTLASPGQVEITRVRVAGIDTVVVPAGRFESYRVVVMARDTSTVFISTAAPRRVVLVRLADGSQEMRSINKRR